MIKLIVIDFANYTQYTIVLMSFEILISKNFSGKTSYQQM